jgi:hypothetical protein
MDWLFKRNGLFHCREARTTSVLTVPADKLHQPGNKVVATANAQKTWWHT